MPVPRLYCSPLGTGPIELSVAESHHAAKSRRCRVGDGVILFDGAGREADGIVRHTADRSLIVEVESPRHVARPLRVELTIAFGVPAVPRQPILIEKCTELGVTVMCPLLPRRGVGGVSKHRIARWRRTAIEAAKQSGQAWLPELRPARPLDEFLAEARRADLILLADPSSGATPIRTVLDAHAGATRIVGLIGPEGGFTDAERRAACQVGALPIRLTPTILRIETAAIALTAAVAFADARRR